MDKSNPRVKFYEVIKTFKEQISQLLQDDSLQLEPTQRRDNVRKLNNMYDKLQLAKTANSKLPIEFFYRSVVVPYGKYILKQDEAFFLNNRDLAIDGDLELLGDIQFDVLLDEIRFIWSMLDDNNKKIMWRYVLALCKLSDNAMGTGYLDNLAAAIKSGA